MEEAAATEADDAHALLFAGEYGGPSPNFTGPSAADQALPRALLQAQVADARAGGAFALSALWAWQCPTHRSDMVCVWPGSMVKNETGSDAMVSMLQQANAQLGVAPQRRATAAGYLPQAVRRRQGGVV